MEIILKDKIFQFYFKKLYGQKSNYQMFIKFSDKEKVSFLINLYLFISNIENNHFISNREIITNNEEKVNKINVIETELLYYENYNKLMNQYNHILNKYALEKKKAEIDMKEKVEENKEAQNKIIKENKQDIQDKNKISSVQQKSNQIQNEKNVKMIL